MGGTRLDSVFEVGAGRKVGSRRVGEWGLEGRGEGVEMRSRGPLPFSSFHEDISITCEKLVFPGKEVDSGGTRWGTGEGEGEEEGRVSSEGGNTGSRGIRCGRM